MVSSVVIMVSVPNINTNDGTRIMPNRTVFLSYSRQDVDLMHLIRDKLLTAGIPVWTDDNLKVGTPSWIRAIEQAIEDSGVIVVILSPDAARSEWVQAEISYATIHRKPIFPILARGDAKDAIPFRLISLQYLDARNNFDEVSYRLIDAIKHVTSPDEPKGPTHSVSKFSSPKTKGGNHIFMSYVREDEPIMERVYEDLVEQELKVWVDVKNLVAGTRHYSVALGKAIENSDCVVVILSPEAKDSEGVLNELTHAHKHKKPIIPLLVRGDELESVPFVITNAQWIDARENYLGEMRTRAKRKFIADLRYYLSPPE